MTDYRWTPLSAADLRPWAALVNHLAEVDGTQEFCSEAEVEEWLSEPGFDPATDSWGVWDDDQLIAWGSCSVHPNPDHEGTARAHVSGGVHAEHRGRGVGTRLLGLQEARTLELLAQRHPGRPAHLGASGGLEGSAARELLRRHGYAEARYFDTLTRALGQEPEVPEVDGVELVSPGEQHEEPTRVAHETAFRDHWGSGPSDPGLWHQRWSSRTARKDVSTLAIARGGDHDGQVVCYVLVAQWSDREAYVSLVGTVPAYRGRGLAAACLTRTTSLAAASGDYDVVELDVDSASPTGATRLYERLGFTHTKQTAAMRRPVTGAERPAS